MRAAFLIALAALAGAGCASEAPPIPTGPSRSDTTPTRVLARLAGDGQSGIVTTTLAVPLEVSVLDTLGHGVPGVPVQFAVVGTNASLTPRSGNVLTGSDGHAAVRVTLGTRAEAVRVVAASGAAFGSAEWDLLATPWPVLTLFVVSGDSQLVALPGARLEPFAVAVRDLYGNRVAARPAVVFRVTAGAATFGGQDSVVVATDTAGVASATLTSPAPADGDTVRVTASFAGMGTPPLPAIAVGLAFRGTTWDAGLYHVCMLAAAGPAYCWGLGLSGQLGDGGPSNQPAPVAVTGGANFVAVSAGYYASCGLGADGAVSCFGSSTQGGGDPGLIPYRSISVGTASACGVSGSGTVYCWGATRMAIVSPVRFATVSVGSSVTCGLTTAGLAWCWGTNSSGESGAGDWATGTPPANLTPRPVAGGLTFRSLSAGTNHACGVTTAGAAYCWGSNADGQLGDGTTANANAPVPVAGGLTFASISAGSWHTCGLTVAGEAYCWGYNGSRQLGTGGTSGALTPEPVAGGITFGSLSAGSDFTCGVAVGGAAWCWGSNGSGELGIGTIGGVSAVPVAVTGGLLFLP